MKVIIQVYNYLFRTS